MTNTYHVHNCAAWASSTAYTVGARRKNGSSPVRAYECISAGTSASSGGPTGTGSSIVDGGVTWKYLSPVDYTTFASAFAGMGTLTAATELLIWNDAEWNEELNASGNSPTATNTLVVRPADGEGFADAYATTPTAMRYIALRGVGITRGNYANAIRVSQGYTTIRGLQVYAQGNGNGGIQIESSASGIVIDRCLIDCSNGAARWTFYRQSGSVALSVRNCLFIQNTLSSGGIFCFYATQFENCTIVRVGAVTPAGYGVGSNYSKNTLRNCAVFGFTAAWGAAAGAPTASNCATDASSPGTGWTGSLTYSSQFEDIGTTRANRDYRVKAGAFLIDGGMDNSANISAVDIVGTTRPSGSAWDIGAFELVQTVYAAIAGAALLSVSGGGALTADCMVSASGVSAAAGSATAAAASDLTAAGAGMATGAVGVTAAVDLAGRGVAGVFGHAGLLSASAITAGGAAWSYGRALVLGAIVEFTVGSVDESRIGRVSAPGRVASVVAVSREAVPSVATRTAGVH